MDESVLLDLLECPVCLERLDASAKVLPCQHTFCRRCLQGIVGSRGELRCPECRTLVESGVDELPSNILLVRLLDGIKQRPRRPGGSAGPSAPAAGAAGTVVAAASCSTNGTAGGGAAARPPGVGPRGEQQQQQQQGPSAAQPQRAQAKSTVVRVYYEKNINAGSGDEDSLEDQVALGDRSKAELDSHLEKLKEAVKALGEELEDSVLSHPVLSEELGNPTNGDSALKHLKQQASILGNMEAIGLLGSNRCFVEFGAGKGKLSHWIHEAVKQHKDYHFLLVERSSTRFKVDGKHQHIDGQFERLQVDIQHLDFSKVPLLRKTKVSLVGVGKHLCGAATDLALRCMFERVDPSCTSGPEPPRKRPRHQVEPTTPGPPPPGHEPAAPTDHDELAAAPSHDEPAAPPSHDEPAAPSHDEPAPPSHDEPAAPPSHHEPAAPPSHEPVAPPNRSDVCGVAIALCCHHRCEWRHYVGKQFFRDNGLGAPEFAAFRRMSSWATCDGCPDNQTKDPAHEEEHEAADEDVFNGVLSPEERGRVGRLCKLLINQGRVQYLQSKGFTAKLMYYTSPQITLENVLLTAVPSQEGEMCRRSSREFHP